MINRTIKPRSFLIGLFLLSAVLLSAGCAGPIQKVEEYAQHEEWLKAVIALLATCEATKVFYTPLPYTALYARDAATHACIAADLRGEDRGQYYTDASCAHEIAYRPTSYAKYCGEMFAPKPNAVLGNAAAWTPDAAQTNDPLPTVPSQKWTLPIGPQLTLSVEPIKNNHVPFMKKLRYQSWNVMRGNGICQLEMRIYKKDPAANNLKPLLALHAGSWTLRGAFPVLEAQISHYTEEGFVVFASFYRLAGIADGNAECNDARWNDVTADVAAALDWVTQHGPAFGAAPGPVAVMGQSAGAHLTGWLATHRPTQVSRGLMLYGPTDFYDFLRNVGPGRPYAAYTESVGILNEFLNTTTDVPQIDLLKIDFNAPPAFVVQNSFSRLVGAATPPLFMMYGKADTLLPSNQAVLLCNKLGGAAIDDGGGSQYRAVYPCGSGWLHLFEEAKHGLDICMPGFCPSGSSASVPLVKDSLKKARRWLIDGNVQVIGNSIRPSPASSAAATLP